jgi:hypothetical protein
MREGDSERERRIRPGQCGRRPRLGARRRGEEAELDDRDEIAAVTLADTESSTRDIRL